MLLFAGMSTSGASGVGLITFVPGGAGPTTVAVRLAQAVEAGRRGVRS